MESDTAYTRVRALILSRELAAGTLISERDLSETLGLGRTPVRQANRLERGELVIYSCDREAEPAGLF